MRERTAGWVDGGRMRLRVPARVEMLRVLELRCAQDRLVAPSVRGVLVASLLLLWLLWVGSCGPEMLADPAGETEVPVASAASTTEEGEPSGPFFDAEACTRALVPTGMGMRWEDLNHRVSELAWLTEPAEGCGADEVLLRSIGGDFTTGDAFGVDDRALFLFRASEVEGGAEEVGFARIRVPTRIGAGGVASGELELSREALALRGYREVVALVGGVSFSTNVEDLSPDYPEDYDPSHGYTTRGIGARVSVLELEGDTIRLDWWLRFEAGLSGDRPAMNRAAPFAESEGLLDVLLVGLPEPRAQSASVAFSQASDQLLSWRREVEPADEALQRVVLEGEPAEDPGFWGVSGFDWRLEPPMSCSRNRDCAELEQCDEGTCTTELGRPGYYIRSLVLDVTQEAWDAEAGRLTLRMNAFSSNSSRFLAFFPFRSAFEGEVRWIPAGTRTREVHMEPTVDAGTWRFGLEEVPMGTWPEPTSSTGADSTGADSTGADSTGADE